MCGEYISYSFLFWPRPNVCRWKSPAVWGVVRGGTSLRVWAELHQFSPPSHVWNDQVLTVYLTAVSCLNQSPPMRKWCSSASSPSAVFLLWPRGRFSIWGDSSRPRSWLSESIFQAQPEEYWRTACTLQFAVFLHHISSIFISKVHLQKLPFFSFQVSLSFALWICMKTQLLCAKPVFPEYQFSGLCKLIFILRD